MGGEKKAHRDFLFFAIERRGERRRICSTLLVQQDRRSPFFLWKHLCLMHAWCNLLGQCVSSEKTSGW